MAKLIDLTGRMFGSWTVVGRASSDADGRPQWACRCSCGALATIRGRYLREGDAAKCAACRIAIRTKHGESSTRLNRIWRAMKQRCGNPKSTKYPTYGGKGITVCDAWQGFEGFRDWARANGYADHLSIERNDPSKGYSPENCEWITLSENSRRGAVSQWTTRQKTEVSAAAG